MNIHKELDLKLINAVYNKKLEKVQDLLNQGVDVHAQDNNALQWAAYKVHLEIVQLLLEHGADSTSTLKHPNIPETSKTFILEYLNHQTIQKTLLTQTHPSFKINLSKPRI